MKNTKKILCASFVTMMLFGCTGGEDTSSFHLYSSAYDNGKICENYHESETSEKEVFVYIVVARNETGEEKTLNASDFTLHTNDKDYPCLYFAKSTSFSNLNGVSTSYISESASTITVSSSETEMFNILPCFAVESKTLSISYQGAALKGLGEN